MNEAASWDRHAAGIISTSRTRVAMGGLLEKRWRPGSAPGRQHHSGTQAELLQGFGVGLAPVMGFMVMGSRSGRNLGSPPASVVILALSCLGSPSIMSLLSP